MKYYILIQLKLTSSLLPEQYQQELIHVDPRAHCWLHQEPKNRNQIPLRTTKKEQETNSSHFRV